MAVYILVNAALLYAMPIGSIAASKLPAADFATKVFGSVGGTLITCIALCSIIGILNAALMYVPRILFAMSRGGFLPARIAQVNTGGTPAIALFLTVVIALIFAMSGTYETLLEIGTFLVLAGDSAVYLAIFVLRRALVNPTVVGTLGSVAPLVTYTLPATMLPQRGGNGMIRPFGRVRSNVLR